MVRRQTTEQTASRVVNDADRHAATDTDLDQIVERLGWTPKQRLTYLVDMLAFEERARAARRVS
jgi:hypothetical protein